MRDALAVRQMLRRLGDPRVDPSFRWCSLSACRPLRPREVHRLLVPSSFADDAGLRPSSTVSALPSSPTLRFSGGDIFGAYLRFALATTCRFARPPVGADQVSTQPTGTFTPGLSTDWSPSPPPGITTGQLGNFPWRDFHPLEHQLASLQGRSCPPRLLCPGVSVAHPA